VNTGAPLPYGSGYSTFNASCTGGQPLDVLMESRMRWKSQVRFGVAAARRPPAGKPTPAPRRRPCVCRRLSETAARRAKQESARASARAASARERERGRGRR
jgi:hypothetical protein